MQNSTNQSELFGQTTPAGLSQTSSIYPGTQTSSAHSTNGHSTNGMNTPFPPTNSNTPSQTNRFTGQPLNGSGINSQAAMDQSIGKLIRIRGSANGIIIEIGPSKNQQGILEQEQDEIAISIVDVYANWPALMTVLQQRLTQSGTFFRQSRVALDTGLLALNTDNLRELQTIFNSFDMSLGVIRSESEQTLQAAMAMDIAVQYENVVSDLSQSDVGQSNAGQTNVGQNSAVLNNVFLDDSVEQTQNATNGPVTNPSMMGAQSARESIFAEEADTNRPSLMNFVYRGNLRSGQVLERQSTIIVIGDVNPGAEVLSGGDIFVWGRLRGMAHAGREGDADSIICALSLSPTHLSIAGIALPTDNDLTPRGWRAFRRNSVERPTVAYLVNNQVITRPWDESKPGGLSVYRR
ncbi:MAG: septum site-determining protein MinC [Chloroflexota bacterium]